MKKNQKPPKVNSSNCQVHARVRQVYSFKKGQHFHLDDIYDIQGLLSGKWWEPIDESGEEIIIVKTIKFEVRQLA